MSDKMSANQSANRHEKPKKHQIIQKEKNRDFKYFVINYSSKSTSYTTQNHFLNFDFRMKNNFTKYFVWNLNSGLYDE